MRRCVSEKASDSDPNARALDAPVPAPEMPDTKPMANVAEEVEVAASPGVAGGRCLSLHPPSPQPQAGKGPGTCLRSLWQFAGWLHHPVQGLH